MSKTNSSDKEIDVSNLKRGIWLVKVPKYIAAKWEKAPSNIEVAKLKIVKNQTANTQVSMSLSESMICMDNEDNLGIPKNYKLDLSSVKNQTINVFSQPSDNSADKDQILLEGMIVQKLECRPVANTEYMKMKMESFKNAHKPTRTAQHLDKIVLSYKPVANHQHLKDYADKKKAEGKRSRDDKNYVMDLLCKAFEKHQYYNIKDLVLITKQPVSYLKEILKEVCNHNLKSPHKNMWELKPEYRHYNKEDKQDDTAEE